MEAAVDDRNNTLQAATIRLVPRCDVLSRATNQEADVAASWPSLSLVQILSPSFPPAKFGSFDFSSFFSPN